MKKFYVVSMNRASDGALSKLIQKMKEENLLTDDIKKADYIFAAGDRKETFDMIYPWAEQGIPVIHLWAGESCSDWATTDESHRFWITTLSMMQLCTNEKAKNRVERILRTLRKKPNAFVVGNIMMDNMEIDESNIPRRPYLLILYNPSKEIQKDLNTIFNIIKEHRYMNRVWLAPNGDNGSDIINKYVTSKTIPRPQFLGLLKNCRYFITNSSCQYYEAQFLLKKNQIIGVGSRNSGRESQTADMGIPGASSKVIELLKGL